MWQPKTDCFYCFYVWTTVFWLHSYSSTATHYTISMRRSDSSPSSSEPLSSLSLFQRSTRSDQPASCMRSMIWNASCRYTEPIRCGSMLHAATVVGRDLTVDDATAWHTDVERCDGVITITGMWMTGIYDICLSTAKTLFFTVFMWEPKTYCFFCFYVVLSLFLTTRIATISRRWKGPFLRRSGASLR